MPSKSSSFLGSSTTNSVTKVYDNADKLIKTATATASATATSTSKQQAELYALNSASKTAMDQSFLGTNMSKPGKDGLRISSPNGGYAVTIVKCLSKSVKN